MKPFIFVFILTLFFLPNPGHSQVLTIELNAGPSVTDHFKHPFSYGGCLRFDVDPDWLFGVNYHYWEGQDDRIVTGEKSSELFFGNSGANIQAYFRNPLSRNSGVLFGGGLGIYEMKKTNSSLNARSFLQPALSMSSELYYSPLKRVYFNIQGTISAPLVYKKILLTHPRWFFFTAGIGFII